MIVECQNCSTRFQLDDSRVPARGIRVRCSRCKEAFFLQHPSHSASEALHDVVSHAAESGSAPPDSTQDLEPTAAVDASADSLAGPSAQAASSAAPAAEAEEEDWEFSDDFPGFSDEDAADEEDSSEAHSTSASDGDFASPDFASGSDDEELDIGGFANDAEPDAELDVELDVAPDADSADSAELSFSGEPPTSSESIPQQAESGTSAVPDVAGDPQGGIDFGDLEQASSLEAGSATQTESESPPSDVPHGSSMEDQAASLADAPSGDFDAEARSEFGEAGDFSASAGACADDLEAAATGAREILDSPSSPDDDDWDFFSDQSAPAPGSVVIGAMGAVEASAASGQASGEAVGPRMQSSVPAAGASRRVLLSRVGNSLGWAITASLIGLALAWGLLDVPSATYRVPAIVDLGDFHAEQVRGRWVENAQMGLLYVVSGRLVNDSERSAYPQTLEVALLGRDGTPLQMEPTPVGLPLSTVELRELAPDALDQSAALEVRRLMATAIAPNDGLRFETVLVELPDAATSFAVQMGDPQPEPQRHDGSGADSSPPAAR